MKKLTHKQEHARLHKALLTLVADWQACAPDYEPRMKERRSVRSLVEWSERQIHLPEEPNKRSLVHASLKQRQRHNFAFIKTKHIPQ